VLTIYQYIAANDPVGSEAVCNKYGYLTQGVETSDDMAECLEALVKAEGAPALTDIANIHPDKELILETFGMGTAAAGTDQGACGCNKCKQDKGVAQQYVDAAQGNNGGFNIAGINQGGLFILGSILILGLVIVSSHKS
jgi:hypothetical protein